ncbi:MAG: hypothetical protein ACI9NN_002257 [Bacteroidia bacterium]|jgi:hypothetical protein
MAVTPKSNTAMCICRYAVVFSVLITDDICQNQIASNMNQTEVNAPILESKTTIAAKESEVEKAKDEVAKYKE